MRFLTNMIGVLLFWWVSKLCPCSLRLV